MSIMHCNRHGRWDSDDFAMCPTCAAGQVRAMLANGMLMPRREATTPSVTLTPSANEPEPIDHQAPEGATKQESP